MPPLRAAKSTINKDAFFCLNFYLEQDSEGVGQAVQDHVADEAGEANDPAPAPVGRGREVDERCEGVFVKHGPLLLTLGRVHGEPRRGHGVRLALLLILGIQIGQFFLRFILQT